MPIQAVLFDMFDTLMLIKKDHEFYPHALRRTHRYLQAQGIAVPFDRFQEVYIEERDKLYAQADLDWGEPHFNLRISNALKRLGFNYNDKNPIVEGATNEFAAEFSKYVLIDENTKDTLQVLSRKYRLGLVSNFAIPECVHKLLKDSSIDRYFEVITVSGAVNKRKPHPKIFEVTLECMGITASESVFVGDTIDADVEGPKAVGMYAIYIERRTQKLNKVYPDATIKTLSQLPEAILRLSIF
jgi:putative hydrolase of the HAD superfamily